MGDERRGDQESAAMALFDDETAEKSIRRVLHEGRWFFSVIDVVAVLTESARPRKYWNDLKRRLAEDEGFIEMSAKIGQLKMPSSDGKQYSTDAADAETMLRIIQSIPSPKAEPIKQWLARVGTERLAEMDDPSLAVERARMEYLQKGYSDDWIEKRLQSIAIREQLTDEWRERGAREDRQFAKLTGILHEGTFEVKVQEHKQIRSLSSRHNLRDSMTSLELLLTGLAEETAKTLHQARDSQGMRARWNATHTRQVRSAGLHGATSSSAAARGWSVQRTIALSRRNPITAFGASRTKWIRRCRLDRSQVNALKNRMDSLRSDDGRLGARNLAG